MQGCFIAHTCSHLTMGNCSDLFSTGSEFRGGGILCVCARSASRNYLFLS